MGTLIVSLVASVGRAGASSCSVVRVPTADLATSASDVNELDAVTFAPGAEGWAVGGSEATLDTEHGFIPVIERWQGSGWSMAESQAIPDRDGLLLGIDASAADDAWAVGARGDFVASSGQTLIEHWDGLSWELVQGPTFPDADGAQLRAVVAVGPHDAWAGGALGPAGTVSALLERWNGTGWSAVPNPAGPGVIFALVADGPNDVWASGYRFDRITGAAKTMVERWNGHRWRVTPTPNSVSTTDPSEDFNVLTGITARGPGDVWAVGFAGNPDLSIPYQPVVLHFDGARWSPIQSPALGSRDALLWAVASSRDGSLWTVGSRALADGVTTRSIVARWDGLRWSVAAATPLGQLRGVAVVPGTTAAGAVGSGPNLDRTSTLGVSIAC
jgi:hypothetical protein